MIIMMNPYLVAYTVITNLHAVFEMILSITSVGNWHNEDHDMLNIAHMVTKILLMYCADRHRGSFRPEIAFFSNTGLRNNVVNW